MVNISSGNALIGEKQMASYLNHWYASTRNMCDHAVDNVLGHLTHPTMHQSNIPQWTIL